ncbi:HD domain-containing protein [Lutispora saccharofermentans]|uniref:Uncharacterized protein n=1 Tax=Lutispora saccharofermentans TaxID=3024236 RepID=A0ABT1NK08_9FIRM|nr:hypothetical protein [Lutispora saccharofermentans]MCQ1531584.1 hypothetical protein [Lutispora saccharofermentans]
MTKDNYLKPFKDYVKEHYTSKDAAHNFEHIERIINTSNKIIDYGVDEDIDFYLLAFLQCFHGLSRKLETDSEFKRNTIDFLLGLGLSGEKITIYFECLKRHCKSPQRIEEKIVHDSNFIEVVGSYGLARAFNSAGTRGQTIEEIIDILETHYYNMIECKTPFGKIVYNEKKKFAEDFLILLKKEIDWYKE